MIREENLEGGLRAINAIMVIARALAYQNQQNQLAEVLDAAEYLPLLMLEGVDRTEDFRLQLLELVRAHPEFQQALICFDRERQNN